jgi:hypothetical protein
VSGHYLRYREKKGADEERDIKGVLDLCRVRETSQDKNQIKIQLDTGEEVVLRAPSIDSADIWIHKIQFVTKVSEQAVVQTMCIGGEVLVSSDEESTVVMEVVKPTKVQKAPTQVRNVVIYTSRSISFI